MQLGATLALIFLIIMTLAGVVVLTSWMIDFIRGCLKKAHFLAKTSTVRLVQKKVIEVPGGLPDYVLIFRDEEYQQLELQADVIQYDAWSEGSYGKLIYEGKKCVSFEAAT